MHGSLTKELQEIAQAWKSGTSIIRHVVYSPLADMTHGNLDDRFIVS